MSKNNSLKVNTILFLLIGLLGFSGCSEKSDQEKITSLIHNYNEREIKGDDSILKLSGGVGKSVKINGCINELIAENKKEDELKIQSNFLGDFEALLTVKQNEGKKVFRELEKLIQAKRIENAVSSDNNFTKMQNDIAEFRVETEKTMKVDKAILKDLFEGQTKYSVNMRDYAKGIEANMNQSIVEEVVYKKFPKYKQECVKKTFNNSKIKEIKIPAELKETNTIVEVVYEDNNTQNFKVSKHNKNWTITGL